MRWTFWMAAIGVVWAQATSGVASAEIFHWTDAQGVEHFSMDLISVPSEYRSAAEASAGKVGKAGIVNVIPEVVPRSEASRSTGPAAPSPGFSRRGGATPQEGERVAGHDESWWRTRVETLKGEMAALDKQIDACSGLKIPVRFDYEAGKRKKRRHFEARAAVVDRCRAHESSRKAKESQLENLRERAHRQGVPPGWLRSR